MKNKVALITFQYHQNINFEPLINSLKDFITEVFILSFDEKPVINGITNQNAKIISCFDFNIKKSFQNVLEQSDADWFLLLTPYDVIDAVILKDLESFVTNNSTNNICLAFKKKTFFIDEYINYSSLSTLTETVLYSKEAFVNYFISDSSVSLKINESKYIMPYNLYQDYDQFNLVLTINAKSQAFKQYQQDEKVSFIKIFFSPFITFIKELFLKKCIFNGFKGLILANLLAFRTLKVNLFLWMQYRHIE